MTLAATETPVVRPGLLRRLRLNGGLGAGIVLLEIGRAHV